MVALVFLELSNGAPGNAFAGARAATLSSIVSREGAQREPGDLIGGVIVTTFLSSGLFSYTLRTPRGSARSPFGYWRSLRDHGKLAPIPLSPFSLGRGPGPKRGS